MSPLECPQRLAALLPHPRLHLIRFHGVLAARAKLPAQIVPSVPVSVPQTCDLHAQTPPASTTARMSWACPLERALDIDVEHRPNCGGRLKIIAAIVGPAVITTILTHRARTAPITGAASRSVPRGLIAHASSPSLGLSP